MILSQFLTAFREPDELLHVRALKPKKESDTPENRPLLWDTNLAELTSSRVLQSTLRATNETRGIYFCPNVGGATDDSITRYTAFFAEDDSRSIPEQHSRLDSAPLPPSIRVQTRNSVHAYWLIAGDCSEAEWRDIQLRLIACFDGDRKIKNPARLMRLPEFNHLHLNGNGIERKKVTVHTFEPSRRFTVAQMREAFPSLAPENTQQGQQTRVNGTFEYHEDRHAELSQRIMARGKRNSKGHWDAKCFAHNGKSNTSLVYFPETGAVSCNADCGYFAILQAEGLSSGPLPKQQSKNATLQRDSDDEIVRLAALPLLEYERQRENAAQTLSCRTSILDKLVDAKRPKGDRNHETLKGSAVDFAVMEPWPEPVNGAEVLDELVETFLRYMVLRSVDAVVLALWCVHTYIFEEFICSPRLNIASPDKGCGKTLLLDLIATLVPRALATENLTVAVLFRVIEAHKPTVLADECDAWLRDNEELRGMLNSGYRRGKKAFRIEGESREIRGFNVFAPVVLSGIGSLPGTLHDRSIGIRLERAKPSEIRLRERFDSPHTQREQELCRKLARFCADNRGRFESCDPELPAAAFNRLADNWRPLFAIAEIAGGGWSQRAASAFAKLVSKQDADAQGIGTMLLADIQQVFKKSQAERIFSKDLVAKLCVMSDRPWPEVRRGGKPITETWLAGQLRPFVVRSRDLRIGDDHLKGYELSDFNEAFERYLSIDGLSKRDSVTTRENIGDSQFSKRDNETACRASETHESPDNIGLSRCHASNPEELHRKQPATEVFEL